MNIVERGARRLDAFQRTHRPFAFTFGVFKKFGDDDAGRLAGLIAYYGFFSLFPLLLVLVSVLGFVLDSNPHLRREIIDSALAQFPVIGHSLASGAHLHGLVGSWPSVIVGGITAIWAGLGVAQSAEVAMNTVWDVPRSDWPNFIFRRVRAAIALVLFGTLSLAAAFVGGYGTNGALHNRWLSYGAWGVAFVLNLVLFEFAFQVLTVADLKWSEVAPGAVIAAVCWTVLQNLGGYYVGHELRSASDVYGTFALVLALLVWISIGAQLTLLCAEINVVLRRHLWPRSLVQPPINDGDRAVYAAIAERARMRPEVAVHVWFTDNHEKGRYGRSGEPSVPEIVDEWAAG